MKKISNAPILIVVNAFLLLTEQVFSSFICYNKKTIKVNGEVNNYE